MLTTSQRELVLQELSSIGVKDVYFFKDYLWVTNSYDIPDVEEYLNTSDYGHLIWYKYSQDEPI